MTQRQKLREQIMLALAEEPKTVTELSRELGVERTEVGMELRRRMTEAGLVVKSRTLRGGRSPWTLTPAAQLRAEKWALRRAGATRSKLTAD